MIQRLSFKDSLFFDYSVPGFANNLQYPHLIPKHPPSASNCVTAQMEHKQPGKQIFFLYKKIQTGIGKPDNWIFHETIAVFRYYSSRGWLMV